MGHDVLIVGAGLTSALLSRLLNEAQLSVAVVEKARGPGGRAATKRIDFENKTFYFNTGLKSWPLKESDRERLTQARLPQPSVSSNEAMNQWVKQLFDKQEIQSSFEVCGIDYNGHNYLVQNLEGKRFEAKNLVITAPWPQSQKLTRVFLSETKAETIVSYFQGSEISKTFIHRDLKYQALLTLMMVSKDAELSTPADWQHFLKQSGIEWRLSSLSEQNQSSLAVADLLLQDDHRWMNLTLNEIETELLSMGLFKDLHFLKVHRWRYAYPLEFFDEDFTEIYPGLYLAGDVWAGNRTGARAGVGTRGSVVGAGVGARGIYHQHDQENQPVSAALNSAFSLAAHLKQELTQPKKETLL